MSIELQKALWDAGYQLGWLRGYVWGSIAGIVTLFVLPYSLGARLVLP